MEIKENLRFSKFLRFAGFLVFGYLLLLSLSYSPMNSAYQPIVTLLVGILIWFVISNIRFLYVKYGGTRILLVILFIGGMIRFLWAVFVPTLPFSDFQVFHESAIKLSQGTAALTKNMGYTLLLSVGYRIYPHVLTGKLINAAASTLTILFLFLLGSKLVNKQMGLIAGFLFAVLPSEILMVSVLGTEVLATTLSIITAFFIFRTNNVRLNFSIASILLAGLFYGLGLSVRSSFIFYMPAILFWTIFISFPQYQEMGKVFGSFFVGTTIGLSLLLIGYSLSTNQFSLEPLRTQDSFPLLSGTNEKTAGTWGQDDANLYSSWPIDERNALARQEAVKRIKSNPVGLLLLLPKKFSILMSSNDYGNSWSLHNIDWGIEKLFIALLSQSVYVITLLFAFLTFKNFSNSLLSWIVLTIVLSTLVPHVVLEVQGRYHHYMMPFLILLASNGLLQNKKTALFEE